MMDLTISLQVLLGPSVIVTTDPAARGGRGAIDSSSHLVNCWLPIPRQSFFWYDCLIMTIVGFKQSFMISLTMKNCLKDSVYDCWFKEWFYFTCSVLQYTVVGKFLHHWHLLAAYFSLNCIKLSIITGSSTRDWGLGTRLVINSQLQIAV